MLSRIEFLISETFISLRRHPAMAFAAVICIAASLFVSGIVGLVILNADHTVDNALGRVRFKVFFQTETSRQEAWVAYKDIAEMPGVATAEFVAKEKAWDALKKKDHELAALVQRNPYPDSVTVKPVDVNALPALKKEISSWPEVHSVRSDTKVSRFLETARVAVNHGGAIVGVILAILSLVIIHHTIELTLYARRKEIFIMSLVGATPDTVAMPFLLEGIVYGLLGGGIAAGTLFVLYRFTVMYTSQTYHTHLLTGSIELTHGVYALLIAGAVLGLLGSVVSVVKYLHRPRSKTTNA